MSVQQLTELDVFDVMEKVFSSLHLNVTECCGIRCATIARKRDHGYRRLISSKKVVELSDLLSSA
jgi:hypothetical protein